MLLVRCMRVCVVIWNLSFVDSPVRANLVELACLDRFVRSNGLLDNFDQNLLQSIILTADGQKIRMKILPYGTRQIFILIDIKVDKSL